MSVEFEEATYATRSTPGNGAKPSGSLLVRWKVASTEAAAQKILLGIAIAFFGLTAWFVYAHSMRHGPSAAELRGIDPTKQILKSPPPHYHP